MEKAYIILAHKNPTQLLKLITKLDDSKSTFFLHIDKKADIQDFKQVINYSSKIHLVKREYATWGSLNLVRATLNALEAILNYKFFDRITLLSGQDYPTKSNDFINQYFTSTNYSVFVEYTTIPDFVRWKGSGGMYRINKYFIGLKPYQKFASKALNFSSIIFPFLGRKPLRELTPFGGSQWWTIDDYALKYILDYVAKNPLYTAFHKYTFAPDEIYFQSILLNSGDERILKSLTNNNLMYSRWHNSASSHPELLGEDDVNDILISDSLFARKFEQEKDSEVFNLINEALDKQNEPQKAQV